MKYMILLVINYLIIAQTGKYTLSGNIYDEKNGEAIIGASVYIKELKRGTTTNFYGFFSIPEIVAGKYTLQITSVGYEPLVKSIEIKSNKMEKINLKGTSYQLKEIVVKGDSVKLADQLYTKNISVIDISPVEIKKIPQFVESDLLRTFQSLPGILSGSDYSSALYVRGGRSDQNLFLLDGTDVYNPEHAFGLFSTFNTDAIKRAEMIKGGFGAEYGGRLSSVINIINIDGNRNNFEGVVNISLLSARTTLQSPLWNIGSISGSFRRTYLDAFVSKISDELPNYYFYDGNIKAFLDISESDKLSLSYYGGRDDLFYKFDKKNSDSPEINYIWGNKTGSINYRKIINNDLFANLWLTYSNFNSKFNFNELDINEKNVIDDFTGKVSFEYDYNEFLKFTFGAENKYLYGLYKQKFPGGRIDFSGHKNYFISYLSVQNKFEDYLIIDIGLRYDQFNSDKIYYDLNPRFSIKYRIDESQSLKFSTGRYTQYLNKIERGFIVGIWTVADKNVPPSSSNHYILGWSKEIYDIYGLELDAYYKTYKNISILNPYTSLDIEPTMNDPVTGEPVFSSLKGVFNQADAYSYGLELLVKKDYGYSTGWLGYSLALTKNKINGFNDNNWFYPRYDRRHVVNFVFNTNLSQAWDDYFKNPQSFSNSKWLMGFNLTFSSGQYITYPSSFYFSSRFPDNEPRRNIYPGKINKYRLPYYMRADFSLTYEKQYEILTVSYYLQIFNIGNRKNVWFIQYDYTDIDGNFTNKIDTFNQIPFLPTIGVTIKF